MDFERDLYRGAAGYYPEMFRQPFYMSYPAGSRFMDEAEYERDSRRLQEMYPKDARAVQMFRRRCRYRRCRRWYY